MFRRGCEARSKYFSAWPLGGPLCSGGDLNPILGYCFPLFSMVFPRKLPSGVENGGFWRKQNCCKLLQVYVHFVCGLLIKNRSSRFCKVMVTQSRHYGNAQIAGAS